MFETMQNTFVQVLNDIFSSAVWTYSRTVESPTKQITLVKDLKNYEIPEKTV